MTEENPLLVKIRKAKSQLPVLRNALADQEKAADADDHRTKEEKEDIQDTKELIDQLEQRVKEHEAEFEKNGNAWNALEAKFTEYYIKARDMSHFGYESGDPLLQEHQDIRARADAQFFLEATDRFNVLVPRIDHAYQLYLGQKALAEGYIRTQNDYRNRMEKLAEEDLGSDVTLRLKAQIEQNIQGAQSQYDQRNYDGAVGTMLDLAPLVGEYESEVFDLSDTAKRVDQMYGPMLTGYQSLKPRAEEFDETQPGITQIGDTIENIDVAIGARDYHSAESSITAVEGELQLLETEVMRLLAVREEEERRRQAEKEEWEGKASRWQSFGARVVQLRDWHAPEAPDLEAALADIEAMVAGEDHAGACAAFDPAEAILDAIWPAHLAQVAAEKAYAEARGTIEQRLAPLVPLVSEELQPPYDAIQAALESAEVAATGYGFVAAESTLADVTPEVDRLEQLAAEHTLRLSVADEMGVGPDTSSPDVEAEVDRRLFETEYEKEDTRIRLIADTLMSNPLGETLPDEVEQARADLDACQPLADGGDYTGALQSLRSLAQSATSIEGRMRKMEQHKQVFEGLDETVREDLDRLAGSVHEPVRKAVEDFYVKGKGPRYSDFLLGFGEYEKLTKLAQEWMAKAAGVQTLEDAYDDIASKVAPRFAALQRRIELAEQNTLPEAKDAAAVVMTEAAAVEEGMAQGDINLAERSLSALTSRLTEFEDAAQSGRDRIRYEAKIAGLSIELNLSAMEDTPSFPESEEQRQAAKAADDARVSAVGAEDWDTAISAVETLDEALKAFTTRAQDINKSKISYDTQQRGIIEGVTTALDGAPPDYPEVAKVQQTLAAEQQKMETAAGEQRWIAALEHLNGLRAATAAARVALRDHYQAHPDFIIGTLRNALQASATVIFAASDSAIDDFEEYVNKLNSDERGFQKGIRYGNYMLDFAAAIAGACSGPAAPMWAAGFGVVKIVLEAGATKVDESLDEFNTRLCTTLVTALKREVAALKSAYKPKVVADRIRDREKDLFKQLGNALHGDRLSEFQSILEANGYELFIEGDALKKEFVTKMRKAFDDMLKG
ncbi:MAG: hypothetical protein AAF865_01870 [Pseudomonadota bacterium]